MLDRRYWAKNQAIRIQRAKSGAKARWDKHHENLADEPVRTDPPKEHYEITVKNLLTGSVNVLLFRQGSRRGRYKISVNDKFWKECGFDKSLDKIRESCVRMGKHE